MKCLLCKGEKFTCIHKGTRDIPELNVMRYENCGMVQFDSFSFIKDENYAQGG